MKVTSYGKSTADEHDEWNRNTLDAVRTTDTGMWINTIKKLLGPVRVSIHREGSHAAAYLQAGKALTPGEVASLLDQIPHLLEYAIGSADQPMCPDFIEEDDGSRTLCALPHGHKCMHVDQQTLLEWCEAVPFTEVAARLQALDHHYTAIREEKLFCRWCQNARGGDATGLPLYKIGPEAEGHAKVCRNNPLVLRVETLEKMLHESLKAWEGFEVFRVCDNPSGTVDPRIAEFQTLLENKLT
jgi:hypothetical protein